MKFSAVLLIVCILFLSSFSGMVSASIVKAKIDCCKKLAGNDACHRNSSKKQASGCEKPGCAMLFSCSICGFIPVGTLRLESNFSFLPKQPVPLNRTPNLSDYQKADWKPPKIC